MYTVKRYTSAGKDNGTTRLIVLHDIATKRDFNVGLSFTNNDGYTTQFDVYDKLNDLMIGTVIKGTPVTTGHGYPSLKPDTIAVVAVPEQPGGPTAPDAINLINDAQHKLDNPPTDYKAKPLVQYTDRLTEADLVTYFTTIVCFGQNNTWQREAPLLLPDHNNCYIDLITAHARRVNAYEFKLNQITAADIQEKLVNKQYAQRIAHTYPRTCMSLTFTGPAGIAQEAIVALRSHKSPVRLMYTPASDLLAQLVQQVLESHTAASQWFIAKSMYPLVKDAPINNESALAVLYNYLNVATLLAD